MYVSVCDFLSIYACMFIRGKTKSEMLVLLGPARQSDHPLGFTNYV